MLFAIGMTAYNPTLENIEYILKFKNDVFKIYIYDNSKNNFYKDKILDKKVNYNYNGKNDGLSKAFNWFLKTAYKDDVDFLLLLDQDSMFPKELIINLMNEIQAYFINDRAENVAVYAYETTHCGDFSNRTKRGIYEVKQMISSGSFLNVKLLFENQLFYDEQLFIDHVDFEFYARVRQKGYKLIVNDSVIFKQELGYYYKGQICHSPVRHYYMVRDIGYLYRKKENRLKAELMTFRYYLRDIMISFKEDETFKKILFATRGYLDYKKNVIGEYKKR